ncbi:MAG: LPS-assembly protein LptD, partial [Bacteroidales bacterium]|nr:LPS-assembly protein LptD [Bacteroidales bacterium]
MMSSVLGLRPSYFVFAQNSVRDIDSLHPKEIIKDSLFSDSLLVNDSLSLNDSILLKDSILSEEILADSVAVDSVKPKKSGSGLVAVVDYQAKDSLIFDMGNRAYLYGESKVTYDEIALDAERIQLSLDSSLVHADGVPDTTKVGKLIGTPKFKDNSGEYEMKHISYNFKTAKGHIRDVVTKQGDGYVTGGTTKKMPDNDIFLENGRYTTCDQTECPHFYIQLTKGRVRPNKNIVTGPAYLVVADVPLPLAIPFGYFPFTKSYSSGILMPTYGADYTMGLYLRNGGYYFAINDYVDLTLTGDFYTKGTWGVNLSSKYALRYKFSGNVQFSYMRTVTGEKGMPDYSVGTNFKAVWSHTQDSRFNPNLTLSASVNFSTSGYERSNVATYYSKDMTQSTKQSTINVSYKFPNSLWSISGSASITQRQQDSTLVLQLPDLSISMSRFYPFKRKVKVGAERWYEKINMTYKGQLTNSVQGKQDEVFKKNFITGWTNGMKHDVPISATFTLLNYINISPSFSITDRMYTNKTVQHYDPSIQNKDGSYGGIAKDTLYGFYNVYNFSTSISASTKLYGMYKPLPIFKNAKLVAVRHLFTPTISFNYNPDFSDPKYGSWSSFQMPDSTVAGGWKTVKYSPFNGYKFGTTGQGMAGSINLTLTNNIEAKFRSDKDSTGYKKVSIIDNLSTSISYNLAADSMRWSSTLPVNATLKLGKVGTVNLQATFDNYMYEVSKSGAPIKVDKTRWSQG